MKKILILILLSILFLLSCNEVNPVDNNYPPIDIDGNVYTAVTIGSQVWTMQNLRVTHYNDGSAIPCVPDSAAWANLTTPGYCYYDNDSATNAVKYGVLYNWHTIGTGKLAPIGWHIPTDAEWDTLQNYLIANGYNWNGIIGYNKIAKSMAANTDWTSYTTEGTPGNDLASNNRSGFTGLPGGYRNDRGGFRSILNHGLWWSASEPYATFAYYRYIYYYRDNLNRDSNGKGYGFSVRLVKD